VTTNRSPPTTSHYPSIDAKIRPQMAEGPFPSQAKRAIVSQAGADDEPKAGRKWGECVLFERSEEGNVEAWFQRTL
jgi:hypothetical protein